MLALIEQSAVHSYHVALYDWPIPDWGNHTASVVSTKPGDNVLDQFHLPAIGKDGIKFFVGRLKETESRIVCAINNLNVLHPHPTPSASFRRAKAFASAGLIFAVSVKSRSPGSMNSTFRGTL
jgi:hypothetical protein